MSINPDSMVAYSSAAERNRQPILEQLQTLLPEKGRVLEIGSGTGQHAVFFSQHLVNLQWQPSDRGANLDALRARFSEDANPRILPPLKLDVLSDSWPDQSYAAVYSANTAHIMSWRAVVAMFTGVATHLDKSGSFSLYGPFNINGCFTSESNARFDMQLRNGDPEMGVRDMAALESLAAAHHMYLDKSIAMPANNFILVFIRK